MNFSRIKDTVLFVAEELLLIFQERSSWVVLFSGVILGFIIGLIILKIKLKFLNKGQANLVKRTVKGILSEKSKSEAILNDLDVGILAYGNDGYLINSNPAFMKIMKTNEIPQTYKEFLMVYGQDNGLIASSVLGTETSEGLYSFDDRIVKIKIKESIFENNKLARIIVIQDITEQENEEKRRKEFVANVSHELKTPLTTIKTYSESLLEWGLKEKNKETVRKDIHRIHDDAVRMGTLVEDLLLLSSIDSKEMRPNMDQYNLNTIVKAIVERMQIQAHEKNIKLICYSMTELPAVFINRTSVERIIINILSNAIKYTDSKGEISVYLGVLVEDVYVKISDTGFGIEKENLSHIFKRFYRVDMTGSRMYGGTGLGLSIAKELAQLHGGDITVSSTLGKGSDFIVRLPFALTVFKDAMEYEFSDSDNGEIMYKMAREFLIKASEESGIKHETWNLLTKEQREDIIRKAMYSEEFI